MPHRPDLAGRRFFLRAAGVRLALPVLDSLGANLLRSGLGLTALSAGTQHALAVERGGRVLGWGSNASGQVGDGTGVTRSRPVGLRYVGEWVYPTANLGFEASIYRNLPGGNNNGQGDYARSRIGISACSIPGRWCPCWVRGCSRWR